MAEFGKSPLGKLLEPLVNGSNPEPLLAGEGLKRFEQFLLGLKRYLETPLIINTPDPRVLWHEGTTVLRNYGQGKTGDKPLLLFVPSLINRANILDLVPEYSLLRYLASEQLHPVLLDWQEPGEEETRFALDDYAARIARAVAALHEEYGKPVILAGYCMGGLLSLAVAQLHPAYIRGLALLATPWDFTAPDVVRAAFSPAGAEHISAIFSTSTLIPHQLLHAIFYSLNPWNTHDKFRRLAALRTDDALHDVLIAREVWANTGIDLPPKVAHTTFVDWACHNSTLCGDWRIGGEVIDPSTLSVPAFVAIPKHDPVVPPKCAEPLAALLPRVQKVSCVAGHIGMIAGKNARRDLWIPLANWARNL